MRGGKWRSELGLSSVFLADVAASPFSYGG